jgi:hypothetical protein
MKLVDQVNTSVPRPEYCTDKANLTCQQSEFWKTRGGGGGGGGGNKKKH